jgi:hypothetical protein
MWTRRGLCAAAIFLLASPASGQAFVELALVRVDDAFFPSSGFLLDIGVAPDVPGVTAVTVAAGALGALGYVWGLENEGGPIWDSEQSFTDLNDVKSRLDGSWTITVSGTTPSVTSFSFDAASFMESTFFQTPTIVSPTHMQTVSATPMFSWVDPTGPITPFALLVEGADDQDLGLEFGADSLSGELAVTDTSWSPPPLQDASYELDVIYLELGGSFVSTLSVDSGNITWGDSPEAPPGYPANSPLLAVGSDTIVGFTVPEPRVLLLELAALGLMGGLARVRRVRAI